MAENLLHMPSCLERLLGTFIGQGSMEYQVSKRILRFWRETIAVDAIMYLLMILVATSLLGWDGAV